MATPKCPNCNAESPDFVCQPKNYPHEEYGEGESGWRCKQCEEWFPSAEVFSPEELQARRKISSDIAKRLQQGNETVFDQMHILVKAIEQ